MKPSLPSTNDSRPDRIEWLLMLLILLSGLVFRVAFPARMAVEHFDEGIYASNFWFEAEQRFRYPARHLYAPPLVPWLLEWSQVFLGHGPLGTMIVGVASGILTVGLLWWSVRGWFGISAGLSAAILAAWSDYHIIYSRTALTEPVLCLLLLASVFFLWRAVANGNSRWAVVAGLCTGLAWCAKYNGWLPLAIGIAGLCGWAVYPQAKIPERGRRFLVLGVSALLALLVVFPVWWDLRTDGGYRAVQENHARYLVGVSGWNESFHRQAANHHFFDGPLSWLGLGLAVLLFGGGQWLEQRPLKGSMISGRLQWPWLLCSAAFIAVLGMWLGTSVALAVIGFVWLIAACPWWRGSEDAEPRPSDLAYWLIAAWFVGLFLTTPLYTPYPRLSLPWLMAAWITAAAMIGSPLARQILGGHQSWQQGFRGTAVLILLALVSLAGLAGKVVSDTEHTLATWDDRTGLEQSAVEIQKLVQSKHRGRAVVYVFAEPALFFHLRAQGLPMVAPIADLGFVDRPGSMPTYLAFGPHALRSSGFETDLENHADQLELVQEFPFTPSQLVLLNHHSPPQLEEPNFDREQTITLYRLKSP